MLLSAVTSGIFAADVNLIVEGTLESVTNLPSAEFRCSNNGGAGGRLELFTEDLSWNKCAKLIAGNVHDEMAGGKMRKVSSAYLNIGGTKERGVAVEPGMYYEYSFELKGDVSPVIFRIYEISVVDGKETRKSAHADMHYSPGKDWRRYKGVHRAGPNAKRIELSLLLWTIIGEETWNRFKPGDFILVDNVSIVKSGRFAKLRAALEDKSEPVRVAPFPVESSQTCPFMPLELGDPPAKMAFRAAVNEKKPLPVAIGNMTDSFAQYRVVLETEPKKMSGKSYYLDNGEFGLEGYPNEKITVREALRFKDTEEDPVTTRLDPLVGMNEASVISVPPKEAGAVWFDFDTYGVKPGTYRGRLRVIPLNGGSVYKYVKDRYVRERTTEKIVPVEFTVDPIVLPRESVRPAHLCSACQSEQGFQLEADIGARLYALDTHLVRPEYVGDQQSEFHRTVREYRDWAARRGVTVKFFVKYDALDVSQIIFNPKKDPVRKWESWEAYVHTLAKLMGEVSVGFGDYYVLIRDEPYNNELEMVREAHRRLKKLYPGMQTYISACERIAGEIDYLDYMGDTTDLWSLRGQSFFGSPKVFSKLQELKRRYGAKSLHYLCSTSFGESLSTYFRRHCWRGEQWKVDADMLYQFNIYNYGLRGELSFKVVPKGEISYKADGKFFPSVRYMAYREGVTDIKYVKVLRDMCAGDPDMAAQIDEMVRDVASGDTASPELPASQREKIRQMILEKIKREKR